MKFRSVANIAVAALCLVVLSSCGSSEMSKSEYTAEMKKVANDYVKEMKTLSPANGKLDDKSLSKMADGVESLADSMDDMNPPKDIEKTHDLLASDLHDFAKYIDGDMKKEIKKGGSGPDGAMGAMTGLLKLKLVQDLPKINAAYKKNGYDKVNKAFESAGQ